MEEFKKLKEWLFKHYEPSVSVITVKVTNGNETYKATIKDGVLYVKEDVICSR